jgi:hypothetical protein
MPRTQEKDAEFDPLRERVEERYSVRRRDLGQQRDVRHARRRAFA